MAFATRCNIRRLRPHGTLPSSAEEPYIVDLGRQRNAALAARLTRERLLDEMGDTCTTPSQAGSNRKGIETCMPLREYVSEWMDREVRRNSSENKYVFGEFSDAWAPLREAYALPPCGAACARLPRAAARKHAPVRRARPGAHRGRGERYAVSVTR